MDRLHRRWVWINAIGVTAVINVVLNGFIAWLSVQSVDEVPMWAPPLIGGASTGVDTLGTIFILCFLTMTFTTLAIRRELRRGAFEPIALADDPVPFMRRLPVPLAKRAPAFAAISFAVLAPVALVALLAAGPGTISASSFIIYKVVLGVVLGAAVTPLIAIGAMAEPVTDA